LWGGFVVLSKLYLRFVSLCLETIETVAE